MKKTIFRGSATALVTPFGSDGGIDFETLGRLIGMQIAGGTDALVVCGTTGESATMTEKERLSVIEYTVWKAAGRLPVIAGTGTNSTQQTVSLTRSAERIGADAVLTVCPYYNKPTQEGLIAHFTAAADCSALPVILYDVPSRTGSHLLPETVKTLAKHENIVALKDAAGSVAAASEILADCGEDLTVYAGDDATVVPYLSVGAKGVISVAANILPRTVHTLCKKWFDGAVEEAADLQRRLTPIIKALFAEPNPIPVKAALESLGYPPQPLRLPLIREGEEKRKAWNGLLAPWMKEEYGEI